MAVSVLFQQSSSIVLVFVNILLLHFIITAYCLKFLKDADAGESRNVEAGAGAGASRGVGANVFAGAEPDAAANAGKIPNALEDHLRDNLVNRSYARSFGIVIILSILIQYSW